MTIAELHRVYLDSSGITIDSRKDVTDCIFFALSGPNFNGNLFALNALEKGAKYAVVSEELKIDDHRVILVDDTLKTLQKLARYHRDTFNYPVIGITGSNGKTTTKELIASVLSQELKVAYTEGNLNNHIGVPLTLLKHMEKLDVLIVEMGANRNGEIAFLCEIANPDLGLVTNIGKAHLEGFGSVENIFSSKTALYRYVNEKEGTCFLNVQDPRLKFLESEYKNVVLYGNERVKEIENKPFLDFVLKGKKIRTNLIGDFNLINVLAACAIGKHFGLTDDSIHKGVELYEPVNNRSQLVKLNDYVIVMDAYNANPSSMSASIKNFASSDYSKQKIVVLGDMLELGDFSFEAHCDVIHLIEECSFDQVFLVGPEFQKIKDKAPKDFIFRDNWSDVDVSSFERDSMILLKGSRKIGLENLLTKLN